MGAEKQIRLRARTALSSNWSQMITAVLLFCAVLILIYALYYAVYFALEIENINVVLSSTAAAAVLFVSPMLNGILKMAFNISVFQKAEIQDAFYFFKNAKRYIRTVLLNLILTALFLLASSVTDIYSIFWKDIPDILLAVAFAVSVILKVLIYFLIVHCPLITYSVNDSKSVIRYILSFSFRKFTSTVRLLLSFTGWILLCFFVVPALYVMPYIIVAMVDSATQESNRIAGQTEV